MGQTHPRRAPDRRDSSMSLASTAAIVGTVAGALSIGNSLFGGGPGAGSGGSAPNIYQPYGETNQDANFQNQQSYITGQSPWSTLSPDYAQTFNNLYNDPNAAWAQAAANNAGDLSDSQAKMGLGAQSMLTSAGGQGVQAGSGLWNQSQAAAGGPAYQTAMQGAGIGGSMLQQGAGADFANAGTLMPYASQNAGNLQGAGNAALNTAFDPQNALYNQLFQQNTDQTRAGLEARGLDTSAAGQGIENNSDQNFNIAWQNAQLGRQAQGLGAAEGAYGQGQSGLQGAATTAANLYGTAGNQYAAGSAMPYQLQQQNLNNQIAQYGAIGQGQAGYGNMVGQGLGYGNQAVGMEYNSGQLPYQTSQSIYNNQGTAANNYENSYLQAMTPYQQSAKNSLQYMGVGVNAGNAYSQAAARSWQQGQQNNQNIGAGISGLMNNGQSLYNNFFGGSGGSGGGDYALSSGSLNPGGFGG